VARDRSGIVTAGTALVLQKDNFMMRSGVCPVPPVNTYKNEKLSLNISFMRDLGGSMQMAGNQTTSNCPQRRLGRGTQLFVNKIDVQKDAIVFRLFHVPGNDFLYYADLKFPFGKGSVPTPDQALETISEVLAVQPVTTSAGHPGPTPPPQAPQPAPLAPPVLGRVYVSTQNAADRVQLESGGTFSLQEGGQTFSGTYAAQGNNLKLRIKELDKDVEIAIDGDKLIVNGSEIWTQSTAVLRNQDIIDLAKAGLDDETILAKIAGSNCQFDTSTAALIELKKVGVSGAVQKAMVAAPK
jgi:hypothetical protein